MKRCEPVGPATADVVVVAEHPDRYESNTGQSFESSSSKLLKANMLAAGLSPARCYMTYLHKTFPSKRTLSNHFDSTGLPDDELTASLVELREEISTVNPRIVVPLGNYGLWATTQDTTRWSKKLSEGVREGYSGIVDWRGSIVEGRRAAADIKVLPTYAPESVAGKYSNRVFWNLDFKRAKEQSAFAEIIRPTTRIDVNPQGQDRAEWRRRLLAANEVFFDIEFIGSRLLCVGFSIGNREACVIPTDNAGDISWCRDILLSGIPLGAQNGMFDCSILEWHYGMKLMHLLKYDTMLAAHAAYIELPKDLGTLCSIYTEQPCYWTHIDWDKIKKGQQPISDVYHYNGIDAWVTAEVAEKQRAQDLVDPAVQRTFEFEMSLVPVLWEMSKRGVRVDPARMQKLREECDLAVEVGQYKLDIIADRSINVASGPQVSKLLFEDLGLKPRGRNKKWPKVDDKTLAEIALDAGQPEQKAVIKLIREIRKNRNLISKFCNIRLDEDGRMRSHYNPAGTNTGRLASRQFFPTGTGANGQNFPRDKRVRGVFVPDDGFAYFYNDLERAESLVVAYLTGDPRMLAHHQPGQDAHALLAMELFDCSFEEACSFHKRYMGKQTRHAGNYMEGPRTFQVNVNKLAEETGVAITFAEAKFFIGKYRSLHTGLEPWWRKTDNLLRTNGKLYNLLGRPRQFFDRLDSSLPAAVAFVPQSTVGDVLNIALLRCYNDPLLQELGVDYLMQIHDAIGGQVPKDVVVPAMRRMRELMRVDLHVPEYYNTPTAGQDFSIPIEIAFGLDSWGAVKKWEDNL